MDKLRNTVKTKIHVESDNLIMYGSTSESAGCILRGVMSLNLQEAIKVKSISLQFTGRMTISWTEALGNGHDRLFREEKEIFEHTWTFLPKQVKLHTIEPGSYSYEFELILPGNLPESMSVANFYTVEYRLKALVERSTFLPNLSTRRIIHVSRQWLPLTPEFLEPVSIANQWTNKLDYEITLPTKIYTHGDQIPISIRITPLTESLRVRHLTCTLKEYMICRAGNGYFNGRPRAHGRVLYSSRDDKFGSINSNQGENFIEWTKTQVIPLSHSPKELQCDVQNESVRIRHKIKFVLSLINADGHVSELRAALPITICAVNNTGLPAYEEAWRSLPYDPMSMLSLLFQQSASSTSSVPPSLPPSSFANCNLPSYNSIFSSTPCAVNNPSYSVQPPTYDEIVC